MTLAELSSTSEEPLIVGLNHIALHVRDVDEAARFWIELFDGEPYRAVPGKRLFHVKLPGVVLAFFERAGLVAWDLEFPHYAFTVTAHGMRTIKQRLDGAGVKTHDIWSRSGHEALMYFRDPTGNLFELYCPLYDRPQELAKAAIYGGDFSPPIGDLKYEWQPPRKD